MPDKLKDELQAARGRNSLNTEIVERLERSIESDPAMQIADLLRPVLSSLSDADQAKLVKLIGGAVQIVEKGQRGKRKK